MSFLDFLFPKYCVSCKKLGRYVCDDCFAKLSFSQKTMCLVCEKGALDGLTHPICVKKERIDGCFIGYEYVGVIKKLLYVFKYKPHVTDVQKTLQALFYEAAIQKEHLMQFLSKEKDILVVPIPLHVKKLRMRGYNHAGILAKNLAKSLNISYGDCLVRKKETTIQAGLSKIARKENMKDAFVVKNDMHVRGMAIFLVDDIVTTGSTFVEAAKMLKKAGAKKVYGIAFSGEN